MLKFSRSLPHPPNHHHHNAVCFTLPYSGKYWNYFQLCNNFNHNTGMFRVTKVGSTTDHLQQHSMMVALGQTPTATLHDKERTATLHDAHTRTDTNSMIMARGQISTLWQYYLMTHSQTMGKVHWRFACNRKTRQCAQLQCFITSDEELFSCICARERGRKEVSDIFSSRWPYFLFSSLTITIE